MADFSEEEKVSLLLKKFFGKPSTNQDIPFYSEPSIDARPGVFPSQIYADEIPSTAPADNTFNSGNGKDAMTDGSKSVSSSYSNITYYKKWQLQQVTNGNNQSFKGPSDGVITNILQDMIPFNYDPAGGYAVKLETSAGDQIFDGTGEWAIDPDAGILTFYHYEDVSSIVNSTDKLPYLSFFRYTGNKGFSTISSIWTDSTNEIYYDNGSKTVLIDETSRTNNYALEVGGERDVKIHNNLIAQDITSMSDKSLKNNIRKLKYGMNELKKIEPVLFDWIKDNKPKNNIGLIAQEVEKIIPEIVFKDKYTGLCSIKYDKLSTVIINGLKEVSVKQNKLEKKITNQQKTIDLLLKRIEKLETKS